MRKFFLLSAVLLFFSCADNDANVTNVTAFTVFDFKTEDSKPEVRLSVFAEALSPVERGQSITIINNDTGLSWKSKNLRKVSESSKKKWTGFDSFVVPSNMVLPQGAYTFYYEDYAENTFESSFRVSYNSAFLDYKASDFPEKLSVIKTEKYVLYNANGETVYYGDKKKNWSSLETASAEYTSAVTGRICWYLPSGGSIIMLPPVEFKRTVSQSKATASPVDEDYEDDDEFDD
ncbi:MAG: hypothetical protein J5780_03605 [Treponema sp.]|nr:hypothetical protein [Treponema sp.]